MKNYIAQVFRNEPHFLTVNDLEEVVRKTNFEMKKYTSDIELEVVADEFNTPIINCIAKQGISEGIKKKVETNIYKLTEEERYSAKKQNILAKDLFDKFGGEDYTNEILTNSYIANTVLYKPYFNYLRNLDRQIDESRKRIHESNGNLKQDVALVSAEVLKAVFYQEYHKVAMAKFRVELFNFSRLMNDYKIAASQSYAVAINSVFEKKTPIKELLNFTKKKDALEIKMKEKREVLIRDIYLEREKIFSTIEALVNKCTVSHLRMNDVDDMYTALEALGDYHNTFKDPIDSKKIFSLFLNKTIIENSDSKTIVFLTAKKRYDKDLNVLKEEKGFNKDILRLENLVWESFSHRSQKIVESTDEVISVKKFKMKKL